MSRWSEPKLLPLSGVAGSAGGASPAYTEKQSGHYTLPAPNASEVWRGVS